MLKNNPLHNNDNNTSPPKTGALCVKGATISDSGIVANSQPWVQLTGGSTTMQNVTLSTDSSILVSPACARSSPRPRRSHPPRAEGSAHGVRVESVVCGAAPIPSSIRTRGG